MNLGMDVSSYVGGDVPVKVSHSPEHEYTYASGNTLTIPEAVHLAVGESSDGRLTLWGTPTNVGRVLREALNQLEATLTVSESAA